MSLSVRFAHDTTFCCGQTLVGEVVFDNSASNDAVTYTSLGLVVTIGERVKWFETEMREVVVSQGLPQSTVRATRSNAHSCRFR